RRTDVQRPAAGRAAPGARAPAVTAPPKRKRDMFDYMEGEIVEDYADRVRRARMEKGLSQKDLALQLMVRELLIKKIEKGELIPEEEVRKKLEKVLGIKLVDMVADDAENNGRPFLFISSRDHSRLISPPGNRLPVHWFFISIFFIDHSGKGTVIMFCLKGKYQYYSMSKQELKIVKDRVMN